MISDLDKTLRKLLAQEIVEIDEANVHFDPPDDQFTPALPAIDFFLYDIRENRELRSNEPVVALQEGKYMHRLPPTRVDCSYLITAWAGDIASEHQLLGRVMEILLRYPSLPLDLLQGELAGGQREGQELPLPTTSLQPGRLQSVAEFWQALGGKPKAALNYTVTIAVAPQPAEAAGPPVVERIIKISQTGGEEPGQQPVEMLTHRVSISGRVSAAGSGEGICGVQVTIKERPGQHTTTRLDGDYFFLDLPAGSYRLSFSAPGYAAKTKGVKLTQSNPSATVDMVLAR